MGKDVITFLEVKEGDQWRMKPSNTQSQELDLERSIDMFGLLADVQNHAGIPPISKPRGMPADADPVVKEEFMGWQGLFPSWITAKDLNEYDWNKKFVDGRVTIVNKKTGEKLSRASWTSPQVVEINPNLELVHLEVTPRELVGSCWKETFDLVRTLGKKYGDENVRLVFWFV